MSTRWTEADVDTFVRRVRGVAAVPTLQKPGKPRKYRNEKVDLDGVTFDSKKEAARWQELCLLWNAGKISALRRQVPYALHVNGQLIGRFTPDFFYVEKGRQTAEDVKSPITKAETSYLLRVKLFRALYPEIDFREV